MPSSHYLKKYVIKKPQHDLKGRMPERSEWLVAGGGAKRNPRYRNAHHYASERRENHLLLRLLSRPPDAFHGDDDIPGVALTLNPRLRALGLSPSAFNPSGWILLHTNNRISIR